ncbi:MAG: hypothetical protein KC643_27455 [Nitrospira sp.]|nr:hypothetical protein [Nitrospira sp.]
MPKRSSKPKKKKNPSDINLLAAQIVEAATGPAEDPTEKDQPKKNPAAVALGRLGGLKGGKARAEKLSAKKRSSIAQKAAKARWDKSK